MDQEHYQPLPSNVELSKSDIHGYGIFAKEHIPKDYDFGITHVTDSRFKDGYIRTPLGGFVNHDNHDINVDFVRGDGVIHLITLKDIEPGEELVAKYKLYDPSGNKK